MSAMLFARGLSLVFALFLVGCVVRAATLPVAALRTTAEDSGYVVTGTYEEALRLCRDFPRAFPGTAACQEVGTSAQGRPLVALVASPRGAITPRAAKEARAAVLLVQAGIHAGEIEGKDAGFAFLRDWLGGKLGPAGANVTVVFVPVLNPDGHERRSPNNRPNQRGPREMGFRTNGANLNLNRDYAKADSGEIRAVLELMNRWTPEVYVDLHTTDGAKFQHDIAVMVSPQAARADGLDELAAELSSKVQARLTALGHSPLPFYPAFVKEGDPTSGFAIGDAPPRFSTPYAAERGRLGVLVETHSWRTYKERAESTYHTLQALLEQAAESGPAWQAAFVAIDRELASLAGRDVTLLWDNTTASRRISFRGYKYEIIPSEISGAPWIRYDESTPEVWSVPLFEELGPVMTVRAPARGYIVAGGHAAAVRAVLAAHGIESREIAGTPQAQVTAYRATKATFAPPYEGRTRVQLEGAWQKEGRALDAGSIFVPIAQPRGRLVLHLFEPTAPDSFVAWGQFNTVFEQKEYMEPYVAEEVAREMLARDPGLRAQLQAAKAKDPELAKSPARILDFFYRRHPSWDERYYLVPVFRLEEANAAVEGALSSPAK